jgi:tRNA modification GTPase
MTASLRASACVLTSPARGAIAVIRIGGPDGLLVADTVFRPVSGGPLAESATGDLRLGRIGAGMGDEVVAVIVRRSPPEVEFQSHGGPTATALVLNAVRKAGATIASAEGPSMSAALRCLPAQAEADLARAPTLRCAEILLDQVNGALLEKIQHLRLLLYQSSDAFPRELDELLERASYGLRLVDGWRVAFAGRPNVGKSRLFNALAGYERALVAPTPGTTRDVVTLTAAIDGWPVELVDTAGLRDASDPIEQSGILLAREWQTGADLVLLVLDRSEPLTEMDRRLVLEFPNALTIANKVDLGSAWDPTELANLAVSSETGEGIQKLLQAIGSRLVPVAHGEGAAVPFRRSHVRLLERARRLWAAGRHEHAARALGRLAGERRPDLET